MAAAARTAQCIDAGRLPCGKASLAEVLAARRGTVDARLALLQLQMETAQRWAQLRFLFPDTAYGQEQQQ